MEAGAFLQPCCDHRQRWVAEEPWLQRLQPEHNSATGEHAEPMVLISGRGANNALIEDVCLYNPYAGICINNTAAQAVLRRIFGQPVRYGIMVDQSQDSNYMDSGPFPGPIGSRWGALSGLTRLLTGPPDSGSFAATTLT